ncbi:pyrroline-5-carboxylate reductase [Rhodospirillum centenum]|uniref:Pyrroline-5-carboxylate reductase n=1 Tax=Rhodospirillum centenum (strain ATCC 51521 / SW) TaxID=414684 RepID=B6ITJ3_RHOCS|nr:pyrroline-5-carboxylate reductase [Rhodospirillum centenum]ACI99294.1 pyrroline-5-carboxylate reductase [Rhodospirillum centenum SW]
MGVSLLLVGCGKMGGALLSGWRAASVASRIVVVEPSGPAAAFPSGVPDGVEVVTGAEALPSGFAPDAVVLAVKPQMMDAAAPAYARFAGTAVFLSIAAGRTVGYFERVFGSGAAIVRAMPNTPAAIGRGITAAVANAAVTSEQRDLCTRLLAAAGEVAWLSEESQIDAVTAVSGSGPAYVFLLVEALAKAGEAAGLPPDLAMTLARATVSGSGELLHRAAEPADQLRRNVTSPGGTTQAALDVLMAPDGLGPLLDRAVAAAVRRSRELAG